MMSGNDEGWGVGSRSHEERIQLLRRLRRLNNLARLLDTAVRVPGTGIRFGADSLLGLLPVIGDASGAIIGLAIVNEGRRLGVPSDKLARMLTNIAVDAAVGSVPLLGDAFDVYFKAHKRNIGIILDHFDVEAAELAEPRRR
ncbi:hypothetical protein HNQ75_003698 [Rhizobium flavum]|jgi:hypothetical protein|uniref:DUF4112 domain-containing protein n=2 Tax=Pseudorhizobium flavum TaxID=1335061 RepID=A0A7W9Z0B0_9HYPH|nr:hypothetical protein [Pseudorhizobium flavum]CAD6616166.1 hypothetical protein RFYW14_03063 [Pseudorhizobium flavum]